METNKNVRVEIYQDLLNDRIKINPWRAPEMYPIDSLNESEIKELKKYTIIEFCIEGTKGDRSKFDTIFQNLYQHLQTLLRRVEKSAYLFTSSFKTDLRTPSRTYKGLLPKDLKKDGILVEFNCDEKYSVFGSLTKIVDDNFHKIIEGDFFVDSQTSFILLSSREFIFSDSAIEHILSQCMTHGSRSYINYLKLVNTYCAKGDIIVRMSGDGGEQYISFQIFCCREEESRVLSAISM